MGDFDLGRGTVPVHGKGGKVSMMPLGFPGLERDLEVDLIGKAASEYLLSEGGLLAADDERLRAPLVQDMT